MPPAVDARTVVAIAFTLAAVTLFSLMDVLVKWQSAAFATVQIIFFRSVFALLPIAAVIVHSGNYGVLRTRNPGGHIVRSLVGVVAMAAVFTSYALMHLADAIAITFAAPLFATALSVPMLGERVGIHRWSAVVVGFVGVLVIVGPGSGAFEWPALIALLGAACIGVTMVYVRKLTRTETSEAIVFYFTMTTTICALLALPFFWVTPGPLDFVLLAAIGLLGGTAQLFRTNAAKGADVAILAPFSYVAILWAMLFGYLVWNEVPSVSTLAGAAIVAASGLYIVFRETRQRPRPRGMRWLLRPFT